MWPSSAAASTRSRWYGSWAPDAAIEEVQVVNGAILWATKRDALNRSVMRKLIGGAAYKETDRAQPQYDAQAAGALGGVENAVRVAIFRLVAGE